MSKVFEVTSKAPTKKLVIKASYEKDGKVFFITKAGSLQEMSADEYAKKTKEGGIDIKRYVIESAYNRKTEDFTTNVMKFTENTVDRNGNHSDQIKWWMGRDATSKNGDIESDYIDTVITDLSSQIDVKSMLFKKRLNVSNFVQALAEGKSANSELASVMEYFGRNPIGMSTDKMLILLIDNETNKSTGRMSGILMDEKNLDDFTETFIEKSNMNRDIIISVNKAINHKVIIQRQVGDVNSYYWNDSHVGVTIPEVRLYFANNNTMFKSLVASLEKLSSTGASEDKLIPPDAKSKQADENKNIIEFLSKLDRASTPELEGVNIALSSPKKLKGIYDKIKERTKS